MDETTIPQRQPTHSRDDAPLSAPRGWRAWRRLRRIALVTVGVLAAAARGEHRVSPHGDSRGFG